jgi:hypothetical protein
MPDWPNQGTLATTTILITGPIGTLGMLKVKGAYGLGGLQGGGSGFVDKSYLHRLLLVAFPILQWLGF